MMTKSSLVVLQPAGSLTVRKAKHVAGTAAGLALFNTTLDASVVQVIVDSDRFRAAMKDAGIDTYLGEGKISSGWLASA